MQSDLFDTITLYGLISALMIFMVFIIWDLAKTSKAGRLGTLILFLGLGLCLLAFTAKPLIGYFIEQVNHIPAAP